MLSRLIALIPIMVGAFALSACVTTSMQGYADLQPPPRPIQHIAAIAPPAAIPALATEAAKLGVQLEDANLILPPTRQYSEREVRAAMAAHGIEGVLVVSVNGDTGVRQRYAGTLTNTNFSGTSSSDGMIIGNMIYGSGTMSGSATTTSVPIYRYRRAIAWQARLVDPKTSRKFWVGRGQTQSRGSLFVGDAASANSAASAIVSDLKTKGLIGGS